MNKVCYTISIKAERLPQTKDKSWAAKKIQKSQDAKKGFWGQTSCLEETEATEVPERCLDQVKHQEKPLSNLLVCSMPPDLLVLTCGGVTIDDATVVKSLLIL